MVVDMSERIFSSVHSDILSRKRTTLECIFWLLGTVPFVRGAMRFTFRDRERSCLKASTDTDAAGKMDARRALVSVRARENRMVEKAKDEFD